MKKKLLSVVAGKLSRNVAFFCSIIFAALLLGSLFIVPIFIYFSKDLPDYHQLVNYNPPAISRIYSADGEILSEIAVERRVFKKIDEVPDLVKNAFISAEDQNYYRHPGIDIFSIVRAAMQNTANIGSDRNPVGGSTITQQVVKNFLLTPERTFERKIKEAILAYRINNVYSKDRILELYLNQIYLGNGAYGVAQASLSYFNKEMRDLTIAEAAMLAAMPKAPSLLDPTQHPTKAEARRNWVIDRMYEDGAITKEQAAEARNTPLQLVNRYAAEVRDSGYYNETVRLNLLEMYGQDSLYKDGFAVHTNMDRNLQKFADESLRQGLRDYDRRHGWHGVLTKVKFSGDEWKKIIEDYPIPKAAGTWRPAIVLTVSKDTASIGLAGGKKANIPFATSLWARKRLPEQKVGAKPESMKDVLSIGDIILVGYNAESKTYSLEQIPDINGALIAIEVKTGKILAMTGGYSFRDSNYNRATQALRQPGSAFKPVVYLTALEHGFSPSSIIRDEPISISQGPGMPMWTPKNIEGKYLGSIPLRKALEKSRNLATVHLIASLGVRPVAETAVRLNIYKDPPLIYSMALGAYETTLLDLTTAFVTFASGGIQVKPKLVDRIFDRSGKLIYKSDSTNCTESCLPDMNSEALPKLQFETNQLIDPAINYQMLSMLEGVVQRGTAVRARSLGKHLAGKTGTTNDSKDTWFIGFSPDIVVGVFVGFDAPRNMGEKEQGASVALPIFIDFMKKALEKIPDKEFAVPKDIEVISVDPLTGAKVDPSSKGAIVEAVKSDQTRGMSSTHESEHELTRPDEETQGIWDIPETHFIDEN